jgi:transcription elongation factor GreA
MESYGNEISVSDIKRELIPAFIEQKSWSKWWTKARNELKKNPTIGFSEQKKDVIFVREQPVRYVDDLMSRFEAATSFSARLDIAQEFANNVSVDDAGEFAAGVAGYFVTAAASGSQTKMILSYFLLRDLAKKFGDHKEFRLAELKKEVMKFIAGHKDLSGISSKITSYDSKKEFVNLIEEVHEDWPDRVIDLLLETPIRIHRHVFNDLLRAGAYGQINTFVERVTSGARQVPEVFLWAAKSIFSGAWNFEWLDYSQQYLMLNFFRLLNDFKKTDAVSIRLRNMAVSMMTDGDYGMLKLIVQQADQSTLRRLYDIAVSAGYLEESLLERFMLLIKSRIADFSPERARSEDAQALDDEEILVTAAGLSASRLSLRICSMWSWSACRGSCRTLLMWAAMCA